MDQLRKRLVEVDEILSFMSDEDLNKIPVEVRALIRENKDTKYNWKYDETKELKDQDVARDTIVILSYLNSEYLLDKEQKKLMEQIYQFNEKKYRKEKAKTNSVLNIEDVFGALQEKDKVVNLNEEENNKLVVQKESFFKKIMDKIKRIIHIN